MTWNNYPATPVRSSFEALGVKGDEAELRNASDEFSGHCLGSNAFGQLSDRRL